MYPYYPLFAILFWQGVSIVYLEFGAYEWELDQLTYFNGSSVFFGFLIFCFYIGLKLGANAISINFKLYRIAGYKITANFLLLIYLYFAISLFEIEALGNKYFYASSSENKIYNSYLWFSMYGSFFYAMILRDELNNHSSLSFKSIFLGVLILLVPIFIGNKFSFIVAVILPFFLFNDLVKYFYINKKIFILFLFLLINLVVGYAFMHYEEGSVEYIFERVFLLQGGVFWSIFELSINNSLNFDDFLNYFKSQSASNVTIKYIMNILLGDKAEAMLQNGVMLSPGFPAVFMILNFKIIGCALIFVYGILFGLVTKIITQAIAQSSNLVAFFGFSVWLNVCQLSENGDFYNLTTGNFILKISLLVIVVFLYKRKSEGK